MIGPAAPLVALLTGALLGGVAGGTAGGVYTCKVGQSINASDDYLNEMSGDDTNKGIIDVVMIMITMMAKWTS